MFARICWKGLPREKRTLVWKVDENFVSETNRSVLPTLGRIGIVCGVAITFILGLTGTIYLLSLRNAEIQVPDILGKNYLAGEEVLGSAGLNIRKRASRFAPETKPDTILDQSPRAGDMIKVGQTIAVVISRPPKEGESAPPSEEDAAKSTAPETNKATDNQSNDNTASKNQNTNKNRRQDKDARNKNVNSNKNDNSKSGANVNNGNATNRNRNSNNGNASVNNRNARNLNANNRNASNRTTNANANRSINNSNANKRPPVLQTAPFNSNGNTRRP